MKRRQNWKLAALALALSAGAARAQTGSGLAATWEFQTTRDGGEARLQMQTAPGATATCERLTFRTAGGTAVTLTTDGQKVRVESGPGDGVRRLYGSADRVTRGGTSGGVLTLEGHAQLHFEMKGQVGEVLRAHKIVVDFGSGDVAIGAVRATRAKAQLPDTTPITFDFGFPVAKPAGEQDQASSFYFGFIR